MDEPDRTCKRCGGTGKEIRSTLRQARARLQQRQLTICDNLERAHRLSLQCRQRDAERRKHYEDVIASCLMELRHLATEEA